MSQQKQRSSLDGYFIPKQKVNTSATDTECTQLSQFSEDRTGFLTLQRNGVGKAVRIPSTFDELLHLCRTTFPDLIANEPLELFNIEAKQITESDFSSLQHGEVSYLFVLNQSEGGKIGGTNALLVNITPNKNILLKAGTSEYDVASALAEIIDNSIQAVKDNEPGEKLIQVRMREENGTVSIFLWDNGCGMNANQLRKWATMGVTQSEVLGALPGSTDHSHRGCISRFGVGAKRAGFFLGKKNHSFFENKRQSVGQHDQSFREISQRKRRRVESHHENTLHTKQRGRLPVVDAGQDHRTERAERI